MKKIFALILLSAFLALPVMADEGFACGVWYGVPDRMKNTNVDGVALGLPVASFSNLSGSSLALFSNVTTKATGFEFALLGYNCSTSMDGVQVAFVNLQKQQHGDYTVQVGGYNQTGEKGIQIGLINNSRNNASFQLGIININRNGWLPVMLFVNFSKDFFKK